MEAPRALILITVDCLRADHTGFLEYNRPTTPFLDSLAEESFVFSHAVVAGAPTYYSFPAIMASRYPLAFGRDIIGLAPGENTMASVLSQSGYSTGAFLAGNPYLSRRFGFDSGFDTFRDGLVVDERQAGSYERSPSFLGRCNRAVAGLSHKLGPFGSWYDEVYFQYCQRVAMPAVRSMEELRRFPSAEVIVNQACAWLESNAHGPVFLWLHLMDPHSPYYPPEKAMQWMGESVPSSGRMRYLNSYWNRSDLGAGRLERHKNEVVALYDAGIRWMDAQVARLVDSLRSMGRWENCIFALTADHGEEFLEHGGRYHAPSEVAEEVIRVPLLLRWPGARKRRTVDHPFSLLHLGPTLLEAAGVPAPESFVGRSHWSRLEAGESWEEAAIVESVGGCTNPFRAEKRLGPRTLAVCEARYKLVLDFGGSLAAGLGEKLFDLEKDPKETSPLGLDVERPVRRRLLDRARQHVADSLVGRDPEQCLRARLRDHRLEWTNSATPISA